MSKSDYLDFQEIGHFLDMDMQQFKNFVKSVVFIKISCNFMHSKENKSDFFFIFRTIFIMPKEPLIEHFCVQNCHSFHFCFIALFFLIVLLLEIFLFHVKNILAENCSFPSFFF